MKQRLTSQVPIECHSLIHGHVQLIEIYCLAADFTMPVVITPPAYRSSRETQVSWLLLSARGYS